MGCTRQCWCITNTPVLVMLLKPKFVIEPGPALQSKRAGGSDHTGGQTLEWLEVGPTALDPRAPPRDRTQISKTHAPQIYLLDLPSAIFHTTPNSGQRFEAAILGPVAHHVSRIGREGMQSPRFHSPQRASSGDAPRPPRASERHIVGVSATAVTVPHLELCRLSSNNPTVSATFQEPRLDSTTMELAGRGLPLADGPSTKGKWEQVWLEWGHGVMGRTRPLHSRPSIAQHCISSQTAAPTSPTTDTCRERTRTRTHAPEHAHHGGRLLTVSPEQLQPHLASAQHQR